VLSVRALALMVGVAMTMAVVGHFLAPARELPGADVLPVRAPVVAAPAVSPEACIAQGESQNRLAYWLEDHMRDESCFLSADNGSHVPGDLIADVPVTDTTRPYQAQWTAEQMPEEQRLACFLNGTSSIGPSVSIRTVGPHALCLVPSEEIPGALRGAIYVPARFFPKVSQPQVPG